MNDNYFTIEDIKERTNLNIDFIRRCIKFFKDELSPHITKGEFNALKFDSNAVSIFDKIMQYKNDGLTLPTIKNKLQLPTKQEQNTYYDDNKTLPNYTNNMIIQSLLNEIKESRTGFVSIQSQLTKVYETLTEKEKLIEVQKHQLKLLTDGRPPEDVRTEQIQKELANKENEYKLAYVEISLKEKEAELIRLKEDQIVRAKELKEKETELLRLKYEKETNDQKENTKKEKKEEILNELKNLEGKWFVNKRRKELVSLLDQI